MVITTGSAMRPRNAFGNPKTLACHEVATVPQLMVALMLHDRAVLGFAAKATASTDSTNEAIRLRNAEASMVANSQIPRGPAVQTWLGQSLAAALIAACNALAVSRSPVKGLPSMSTVGVPWIPESKSAWVPSVTHCAWRSCGKESVTDRDMPAAWASRADFARR